MISKYPSKLQIENSWPQGLKLPVKKIWKWTQLSLGMLNLIT